MICIIVGGAVAIYLLAALLLFELLSSSTACRAVFVSAILLGAGASCWVGLIIEVVVADVVVV